jgi:prepilin-type processing-associated H-X9-DG protein
LSYVTAFGTANPPSRVAQSRIADFMVKAMQLGGKEERKLRAVFRSSGIDFRHSVLDDFARTSDFSFFPNTDDLEPFPTTAERMESFRRHALSLSVEAVRNAFGTRFRGADISHLITVCCTGMYAPGLDIDIMNCCGLSPATHRICLNFMGCYAAISAVRTADALCRADADARVLIVCTELCSLHFQKEFSEDNLLANALFADGSAAVIVESHTNQRVALRALRFHSHILKEGDHDMAWNIGDTGFEMKLSSYIPDLIRNGIRQLAIACASQAGLRIEDIAYFAIHPGGKRILEAVEAELNIPPAGNRFAYDVLRDYGNMSSPSVLFVLRRIVDTLTKADHHQHVLSFAFGPGLTMESMVLQVEYN